MTTAKTKTIRKSKQKLEAERLDIATNKFKPNVVSQVERAARMFGTAQGPYKP